MIDINFNDVDLGFVVNLQTFKQLLMTLSIDGKRWWVASDPDDAASVGSITIGHGNPNCQDLLNTIYYQIPVISSVVPKYNRARLTLLFDSSYIKAESPGFYRGDGSIVQDAMEDFISFFNPIRNALASRVRSDI